MHIVPPTNLAHAFGTSPVTRYQLSSARALSVYSLAEELLFPLSSLAVEIRLHSTLLPYKPRDDTPTLRKPQPLTLLKLNGKRHIEDTLLR
jgi:hypothetical protein